MDDGERRSKLFDADESAMEDMSPDFSPDAEPDVFKDGLSYDPIWGQALNKKSDYGDDSEKGRKWKLFGGKAEKVKTPKGDKKKTAVNALKQSEEGATEKPNISGRGGDKSASLGEKEGNVPTQADKYKNAVKGIKEIKSGNAIKGFSTLRKGGPVFVILGILAFFGGASFLGQMSMPFSLVSQLQDSFDSISVSQTMRSKSFLKFQTTNSGRNYNLVRVGFFSPAKFKITNRQKTKLERGGKIQVIDDIGGGKQALMFEGKIIVADASDATNGRIALEDIFQNDVNFRNAYTEGTRTWRGSVAAWFDEQADKVLGFFGIDRNGWRKVNDQDVDTETVRNKIADDADMDFDGNYKTKEVHEVTEQRQNPDTGQWEEQVVYDWDNNPKLETGEDMSSGMKMNSSTSKSEIGNKLSSIGNTLNKASTGMNFICGVMDIATAFKQLAIGYQTLQNSAIVQNFLEGIHKAQAGDDKKGIIHGLGNLLTQKATTTYETTDYDSVKRVGDEYVAGSTSKVSITASAMEAPDIISLYSGKPVDMSHPSVQSFQPSSAVDRAINKIFDDRYDVASGVNLDGMTSASSFKSCTITRVVASAASAVVTVLSYIFPPAGAVYTGATSAGKEVLKIALKLAASVIISFMIPYFTQMLARNAVKEVVGIDIGTITPPTTNKIMGDVHIGSSVANKESLLTYRREQKRIIAEKAQYERDTRSPFDITSKYTFLGSLASQMVPIAGQMSSISGALNGVASVLGNSLTSFLPHASAVSDAMDVGVIEERTKKYCPELYDIGGLGDDQCYPYKVTDMTTIEYDPAENTDNIFDYNLEPADESGDEAPKIKKGSNLEKYLVYCSERQSPFGMVDQNISTAINWVDTSNYMNTGSGSLDTALSSAVDAGIGMIPVVGDLVDVVGNTEKLQNLGWITGAACVTGYEASIEERKMPSWEESKKYQRFIEDQRLSEQIGLVEESAVTKYLTQYYKENPIDASYEGMLARYSGLTKDNVIALLDFVEVQSFVANYKPASLYPYPEEEPEEQKLEVMEDNGIVRILAVIPNIDIINTRKEAFIA